MSLSLRDQRAALYSYSDAGTGDGDAVPTYTYVATRWARVETPTGREKPVAGQAEHVADAVIALDDGAEVTGNGLIRLSGTPYRVTAILPKRFAREVQVLAVRADDASYTLVGDEAP